MPFFMRTKVPLPLLLFSRVVVAIEETLFIFTVRVALLLMSGPFGSAEHRRLGRLKPRE